MIEISPVPLKLSNVELVFFCKSHNFTGNDVNPNDPQACHRFKKKENIIIKYKNNKLKYKIINNRKKNGK